MTDHDYGQTVANLNGEQPATERSIVELFLDGFALYAPDGAEVMESTQLHEGFVTISFHREVKGMYYGRVISVNELLLEDAPDQIVDSGSSQGQRLQLRVRLAENGFASTEEAVAAGRKDLLHFDRWHS